MRARIWFSLVFMALVAFAPGVFAQSGSGYTAGESQSGYTPDADTQELIRELESQLLSLEVSIAVTEAEMQQAEIAMNTDPDAWPAGGTVAGFNSQTEAQLLYIDNATSLAQKRTEYRNLQERIYILETGNVPEPTEVYEADIPTYPGLYESKKPVFTGPGLEGGSNLVRRDLDTGVSRSRDLPALIIGWIQFAFPIVALIAVIAIIYAGFLYIFYYGDEGRTTTAKNIIMYVVIGIVLVFAAFAIVNTVLSAF